MIGNEAMTTILHQRLVARIPEVVSLMNRERGLEEGVLPLPRAENIHPQYVNAKAVNAYPAVMIDQLVVGPRNTTRVHSSTGFYEVYEFLYSFRVYGFVTGANYNQTTLAQLRLTDILRASLLTSRALYTENDESAVIIPESFRESFSEASQNPESKKFLSASFLEFEVRTEEKLGRTYMPDVLPGQIGLQVGLMYPDSTEAIPPTVTTVMEAP